MNQVDPSGLFGLAETSVANSIATSLSSLQVDFGFNFIDAKLNGDDYSASSTGWSILASMAPLAVASIAKNSIRIASAIGKKGKVAYALKHPPSKEEIAAATHVAEELEVGIYLKGTNVKGADAWVSGVKYDIKTITGKRGVSSNIKQSMRKEQASRFIIDGRPSNLTWDHFRKEINSVIGDGYTPDEVIVILGDGSVRIWP